MIFLFTRLIRGFPSFEHVELSDSLVESALLSVNFVHLDMKETRKLGGKNNGRCYGEEGTLGRSDKEKRNTGAVYYYCSSLMGRRM